MWYITRLGYEDDSVDVAIEIPQDRIDDLRKLQGLVEKAREFIGNQWAYLVFPHVGKAHYIEADEDVQGTYTEGEFDRLIRIGEVSILTEMEQDIPYIVVHVDDRRFGIQGSFDGASQEYYDTQGFGPEDLK